MADTLLKTYTYNGKTYPCCASLTMGVMNARADGAATSVWSRMLLGRPPMEEETGNQLLGPGSLLLNSRSSQETTPLLIMGLPRSGSESIHNFFSCNKIQTIRAKKKKLSPGWDQLIQLEQSFFRSLTSREKLLLRANSL